MEMSFGQLEVLAEAKGINLASALYSIATPEQINRIANSLEKN